MRCTKCNSPIIYGENFCRVCGTVPQDTSQKQTEEVENIDKVLADLEQMIIEKTDENPTEPNDLGDTEFTTENSELDVKEAITVIKKVASGDSEVSKPKLKPTKTMVLIVLLWASMMINILLLINMFTTHPDSRDVRVSANKVRLFAQTHYIWMPDNWISMNEVGKITNVKDDTETWSASFEFLRAPFEDIEEHRDEIINAFGPLRYLLISDTTRKIGTTDLIIFRGKFHENTTYIILAERDDYIAIADLKFKYEVNEEVLNAVMEVLVSSSRRGVTDFFGRDFNFDGISSVIQKALEES